MNPNPITAGKIVRDEKQVPGLRWGGDGNVLHGPGPKALGGSKEWSAPFPCRGVRTVLVPMPMTGPRISPSFQRVGLGRSGKRRVEKGAMPWDFYHTRLTCG